MDKPKKKKDKLKKQKKALKKTKNKLEEFLASVQGAAAEADVNVVHNLVNQGIKMKLGAHVQQAREFMNKGKYEDAAYEIDESAFTMGIRWCNQNGTKATPEEAKGISSEMDELKRIRNEQRGRTLRAVGDDE